MMNDKHKFYDFFDDVCKESRYSILVIKTLSSRYSFSYVTFLLDVFYLIFSCAVNYRKNDFIFIREFNTIPFLVTSFFLFPFRKKIILNVNHNFQRANTSIVHRYCILILDFLGFIFFCFESNESPVRLKGKVISIPFVMNDGVNKFNNNNDLSVGFVGSYRKEKNIEQVLEMLDQANTLSGCKLILGTDNKELLSTYEKKEWCTYDTNEYDDYIKAIEIVDILVLNYDEDAYYYRHSGVLTDFINKGKVVIVPSYPYFNTQLNNPVKVGLTFTSLDEVSKLVNEGKIMLESNDFCKVLTQYKEYRTLSNVVGFLDCKLRGLTQ
jgi:hypothetical protein